MYETKESILALGPLDPELSSFYAQHGGRHPPETPLAARRQKFKQTFDQKSYPDTQDSVVKSTETFKGYEGTDLDVLIFRPTSPSKSKSKRPLVIFYHYGGFILGDARGEESWCRALVSQLDVVAVSVSYSLSPEHPFPIGHEDAWRGFLYSIESASRWGADPSTGLIVAGESAGGNIAAGLCHRARNENVVPRITGQVLSCAWLVPEGKTPEKYKGLDFSYVQNADAPCIPAAAVNESIDALKPDLDDPRANILCDPSGHQDLPKAYLMVSGADPFRDGGLIYEKVLREQGVQTRMSVYRGLPHVFWNLVPGFKSSKYNPEGDMLAAVKWLLGREG